MPKTLEVIITSEGEAVEAQAGGADRLEVVRALELGGLTPDPAIVERILAAVSIPIRVMVRNEASFAPGGPLELRALRNQAAQFASMGVDGLVLGFAADGGLNLDATSDVLSAAPGCRATFHRAFDEAADPLLAIEQLKSLPQIDRILTTGGAGTWEERRARLVHWQQAAWPEIHILVGAGLSKHALSGLRVERRLVEVHVGRAARVPHLVNGRVDSRQIATLKSALA